MIVYGLMTPGRTCRPVCVVWGALIRRSGHGAHRKDRAVIPGEADRVGGGARGRCLKSAR